MSEELISCVGGMLAYPIAELCESLWKRPFAGTNLVQSAPAEHGHACAIILLAVAMAESALNRARYISESYRKGNHADPVRALDILEELLGVTHLSQELEEVYVVRDAIAHSHLWEAVIPNSGDLDDPRIRQSLLPGYGDRKFRRAVDLQTQRTRRLSLSVVPTRLTRHDVVTVLGVLWRLCSVLQEKDCRYFFLDRYPLPWRGKYVTFPKLLHMLGSEAVTSPGDEVREIN